MWEIFPASPRENTRSSCDSSSRRNPTSKSMNEIPIVRCLLFFAFFRRCCFVLGSRFERERERASNLGVEKGYPYLVLVLFCAGHRMTGPTKWRSLWKDGILSPSLPESATSDFNFIPMSIKISCRLFWSTSPISAQLLLIPQTPSLPVARRAKDFAFETSRRDSPKGVDRCLSPNPCTWPTPRNAPVWVSSTPPPGTQRSFPCFYINSQWAASSVLLSFIAC